jgi:hypothetical protein
VRYLSFIFAACRATNVKLPARLHLAKVLQSWDKAFFITKVKFHLIVSEANNRLKSLPLAQQATKVPISQGEIDFLLSAVADSTDVLAACAASNKF